MSLRVCAWRSVAVWARTTSEAVVGKEQQRVSITTMRVHVSIQHRVLRLMTGHLFCTHSSAGKWKHSAYKARLAWRELERSVRLEEAALSQVVFDDNVGDGVEYVTNVL